MNNAVSGLRKRLALVAVLMAMACLSVQAQSPAELAGMIATLQARLSAERQENEVLRLQNDALRLAAREAATFFGQSPDARDRNAVAAIASGRVRIGVAALEGRAREQDRVVRGAPAPSPSQLRGRAEDWKRIGALAFLDSTERAISAYEQALRFDPNDVEALDRLAYLYGRVGRADQREVFARRLQSLPSADANVRGLIQEALLLQWRGDHAGALRLLPRAEQLARENQLFLLQSQVHILAAGSAVVAHDFDRAKSQGESALQLAQTHAFQFETAGSHTVLGMMEYASAAGLLRPRRQNLERADAHFREAERVFRELGHQSELAAALTEHSRVRIAQGQNEAAIVLGREAASIAESIQDRLRAAWAYKAIGTAYSNQGLFGNTREADANFSRAREQARNAGSPHTEAIILIEWAGVWYASDSRRSCALASEGLRIFRENVRGSEAEGRIAESRAQRYCDGGLWPR